MQPRPLPPHCRTASVTLLVATRRRQTRRHAGVGLTLTLWLAGCAPDPWLSTGAFDALLLLSLVVGAGLVALALIDTPSRPPIPALTPSAESDLPDRLDASCAAGRISREAWLRERAELDVAGAAGGRSAR